MGQGGAEEDAFVPGFTAYSEPNPNGFEVSKENGLTEWTQAKNSAVWYGYFANAGELNLALSVKLPASESVSYRLTAANQTLTARTLGADDKPIRLKFGKINIPKPGYYRFALQGLTKTGKTFGNIVGLSAVRRRHARRPFQPVHVSQRGVGSSDVCGSQRRASRAFLQRSDRKDQPDYDVLRGVRLASGLFRDAGQQRDGTPDYFFRMGRREGSEDRSKVAEENKVKLLAKGDGVFADSFGNEGTGGHSHLVYNWKTGGTYRFLVTAKIDGDGTIYSGYFFFPEKQAWGLIASFRAPHDGAYPHGLYSFDEDFGGAYGQRKRLAEFGNQWIRTARRCSGKNSRRRVSPTPAKSQPTAFDFGAGSRIGNRFYLASGGYIEYPPIKYGDTRTRPASGKRPTDIPF